MAKSKSQAFSRPPWERMMRFHDLIKGKAYLRAGVFLCGGTSRVPGIATLAEAILHMQVTLGHASAISGLTKTLDEPEFATAIGLVKYGALQQHKSRAHSSLWSVIREFRRMGDLNNSSDSSSKGFILN
jgi:cell division ATPase FtsA